MPLALPSWHIPCTIRSGFSSSASGTPLPFSADTQHTHHYLLRLGYSHSKVTTIILIVNFAGMIVFWILSYFIHSYYVVPIILLTAFLGAKYLQRVENRNRLVEIEQGNPPKQAQ